MVLALIVIMTGALVPALGNYGAASRLKAGARGVVSQMRYARELAVRHNTHTRFEIDADNGVSRVSELRVEASETATGTGTGTGTGTEPGWHDCTQGGGLPRRLPDGVRFARSAARGEKPGQSALFAPDGRSDDWILVLADSRDQQMLVHLEPSLGIAKVLTAADGQDYQDLLASVEATP